MQIAGGDVVDIGPQVQIQSICNKECCRSAIGRDMRVLQRITTWLLLATYLFANTLASSWHDHRDCCRASEACQQR